MLSFECRKNRRTNTFLTYGLPLHLQVLVVQYVMQRSFNRTDWDTIEQKLSKFRSGILEVIALRKRKM